METRNKNVIVILAAVLLAAFFMPWLKFFVSVSAWDLLFGDAGGYVNTGFKYLALLIPIAGAIVIYGAAFDNQNYPVTKGLLFRIPILTLVVITLLLIYSLRDTGMRLRGSDLGDIIKIFGIGFWLTLIASIVLPFYIGKADKV